MRRMRPLATREVQRDDAPDPGQQVERARLTGRRPQARREQFAGGWLAVVSFRRTRDRNGFE